MGHFVIRGARGTMPACGRYSCGFGGNTTCFSIQTDQGMIIVDAGTGISSVSREIAALHPAPPMTILFTHFHLDHVIGLPCFEPLFRADSRITIMADPRRPDGWKETLKTLMGKPYWPIGIGEVDATMTMADLPIEQGGLDLYGTQVTWFRVPHPQQCLSYRIRSSDADIVIATDVEYEKSRIAPAFVEFCRHADFLLFDAQYRPDEYEAHRHWGHSTWEVGAEVARQADVGRLILTHHAPERTDADIEGIVTSARQAFPATDAAAEGMALSKRA